jgi:hypothetical protein
MNLVYVLLAPCFSCGMQVQPRNMNKKLDELMEVKNKSKE